jgi:hypothetical protein
VQIFELGGKLIFSEKISSSNGTINFSTQRFDNGIYLLRIKEGGKILGNKKLIIAH